ncbi:MAG: thioredoxin [Actinoplanes sp.]
MSERLRVPPLAGATEWLNSEPLEAADLRGHVVLFNFWTLTCINWLRQEPYVRTWARAFRDDGLIVVGVHTPEFSFEHDPDLIRRASAERGIDYPVAVDSKFAIWSAFDNHFWPALYFADRDGYLRDYHFGEGRYEASERSLKRLLGVVKGAGPIEGVGVEAPADWDHLRTPETYLGYQRGERFTGVANHEETTTYVAPGWLAVNHWALSGGWAMKPECVVAEDNDGSIGFRFHARDVHLVLNRSTTDPIPFRVLLDGEAPKGSHGVHTDEEGNGVLRDGGMYQLIRAAGRVRERTVEVVFEAPGAEAYAFTFG